MKTAHWLSFAMTASALFALTGCPGGGGEGEGCSSNDDCKDGRICVQGSCTNPDATLPDGGKPGGPDGGSPDAVGPDGSMNDTNIDCNADVDSDGDGLDNCEEAMKGTDPENADTDGDGLEDGSEDDLGTDPTKEDTDGDGLDDKTELDTQTDPSKADTDGDGLEDKEEIEGATDPTNADSDGDGLEDGPEKENGADPNTKDTDGDGLEDGPEVNMHGSDPTKTDSDGDGIDDFTEVNQHGTDPAKADSDGDGIDDPDELSGNTDPVKADTDGDGLEDGPEVNMHMSDPTESDTDGDGLQDGPEVNMHMTDPTKADSDGDGLEDAAEIQAGSNPGKKDTDGDGLEDGREVNEVGSDPTKKNSDNDSLTDKQEADLGLDPTTDDTFGDGTKDGNRSFVNTCLQGTSTSLNKQTDSTGDYDFVLPAAFSYTQGSVSTSTTQNPKAAGVFSGSSGDVHGFIYSVPSNSSETPTEQLESLESSLANSNRTVEPDWFHAPYTTHDGHKAAETRWDLTFSSGKQAETARDETMTALAPFSSSDVSGLPSSSGGTFQDWRVYLTLVDRGSRLLVLGAMSPQSTFSPNSSVSFAMANATATGALAAANSTPGINCQGARPFKNRKPVEFYWVLDQTGSMDDDNSQLQNLASPVDSTLQSANVDHRFGVTNMDPANSGKLHTPPAWHTTASTFTSEIDSRVVNCSTSGGWGCDRGAEYPLQNAQDGLTYMLGNDPNNQPSSTEKIRQGADVYTFFMTDEEANSIKSDGKQVGPFATYFTGTTTAFSLLTDGGDCGSEDAASFREVSRQTGGSYGSLCTSKLGRVMQSMVVRATANSSRYQFNQAPIPSTIEVYVDGSKVSRSRSNGWEYFPTEGSLAFFGSARPGVTSNNNGEYVNIVYQTY